MRFDAYKFTATPLRRRFILSVAEELGKDGDKLAAKLRESSTRTGFVWPEWSVLVALSAFFVGLALLVGIGLGLAAVAAALSAGPFQKAFSDIVGTYVLAVVLAPAVASAFFTLAGKGVSRERSRPRIEDEDEFEGELRALLNKLKFDKLVVFIDELDRCPDDEVVPTLDALRTFLDMPRCIFVVAADRQVLEVALAHRLRQATPSDPVNPYYSAGSAYLDKIFHYQVSLPPLRAARLERYALGLVEKAPGVWKRIRNRRHVVEILIPPHVTSPRRVKVLLNAFALTYRLLDSRDGIREGLELRANELAKLVCLRCEFPLFAADLPADPFLPSRVLEASRNPDEFGESLEPDRAQRALAYATGKLPVALLLSEPADGDDKAAAMAGASPVQRQHSLQLLRYLEDTEALGDPGSDLIHAHGLESDLSHELSEQLGKVAIEDDDDALSTVLSEVRRHAVSQFIEGKQPSDYAEACARVARGQVPDALAALGRAERAAVELVAHRVRRPDRHEQRNAIRALLQTVNRYERSVEPDTAEEVLSALRLVIEAVDLDTAETRALLLLGVTADRKHAIAHALEYDAARVDSRVIELALRHAGALLPRWSRELGEMWATALVEGIGDERLLSDCLLGAVPASPYPEFGADFDTRELATEPVAVKSKHGRKLLLDAVAPVRERVAAQPDSAWIDRLRDVIERLLGESRRREAEAAALVLVAGTGALEPPVVDTLRRLECVREPKLVRTLVAMLRHLPPADWPQILGLIDSAVRNGREEQLDWASLIEVLHNWGQPLDDNLRREILDALPNSVREKVEALPEGSDAGEGEVRDRHVV